MEHNFIKKVRMDGNLKQFFLEYIEEELDAAYSNISKYDDTQDIYRCQGRIAFLKKMKGLANA